MFQERRYLLDQRNKNLDNWDFECLGINEEQFEIFLSKITDQIKQDKRSALSTRGKLKLTLRWLRNYLPYSILGELAKIDKSIVGKIIREVILALYNNVLDIYQISKPNK